VEPTATSAEVEDECAFAFTAGQGVGGRRGKNRSRRMELKT
jgi:hypothetical protein